MHYIMSDKAPEGRIFAVHVVAAENGLKIYIAMPKATSIATNHGLYLTCLSLDND